MAILRVITLERNMMRLIHKDSLHLGGFAGLKEHRLVVDKRIGGRDDTWDGIGNFVYLADAYFDPYGETKMHPHKEIDVISIVIDGEIHHEGSLEHGTSLVSGQVQVQRAGGQGFVHNEINPNARKNRMIQMWVLPENHGEAAGYKLYDIKQNSLTKIYGGTKNQNDTFDSHTVLEVGRFSKDEEIKKNGDFLAYITEGEALVNNIKVKDGDLLRGTDFDFKATSEYAQVILITQDLKDNN